MKPLRGSFVVNICDAGLRATETGQETGYENGTQAPNSKTVGARSGLAPLNRALKPQQPLQLSQFYGRWFFLVED